MRAQTARPLARCFQVRVLSGPFQRPSEAAFSRLAYDVHFGVMKDDTVLADIIRRTTFGEEEYPKVIPDRILACICVGSVRALADREEVSR